MAKYNKSNFIKFIIDYIVFPYRQMQSNLLASKQASGEAAIKRCKANYKLHEQTYESNLKKYLSVIDAGAKAGAIPAKDIEELNEILSSNTSAIDAEFGPQFEAIDKANAEKAKKAEEAAKKAGASVPKQSNKSKIVDKHETGSIDLKPVKTPTVSTSQDSSDGQGGPKKSSKPKAVKKTSTPKPPKVPSLRKNAKPGTQGTLFNVKDYGIDSSKPTVNKSEPVETGTSEIIEAPGQMKLDFGSTTQPTTPKSSKPKLTVVMGGGAPSEPPVGDTTPESNILTPDFSAVGKNSGNYGGATDNIIQGTFAKTPKKSKGKKGKNSVGSVSGDNVSPSGATFDPAVGSALQQLTKIAQDILTEVRNLKSTVVTPPSQTVGSVTDTVVPPSGPSGTPPSDLGVVGAAKAKGSDAEQKAKNQKRQEQKGFIALLIPELVKIFKKSSIWDVLKLLLLKFGKNHPLLAAAALQAGPALLGGGLLTKLLKGGALKKVAGGAKNAVTGIGSRAAAAAGSVGAKTAGVKGPGFRQILEAKYVRPQQRATAQKILDLTIDKRALQQRRAVLLTEEKQLVASLMKVRSQEAFAKAKTLPKGSPERAAAIKQAEFYGKAVGGRQTLPNITSSSQAMQRLADVNKELSDVGKASSKVAQELKATKDAYKAIGPASKTFRGELSLIGKFLKDGAKGVKAKSVEGLLSGTGFKGFKQMSKMGKAGAIAGAPLKTATSLGKSVAKGAKILGPVGTAITALAEVPDLINAAQSGKPGALKKQATKSAGGIGGSLAGAAIGTAVLGPVGTVIGAILGDIIGRVVGPALFKGFGALAGNIGKDFAGMWSGLKATFNGIMQVFTSVGNVVGNILAPAFYVLGAGLGATFKTLAWVGNVVFRVIGGICTVLGALASIIENVVWFVKGAIMTFGEWLMSLEWVQTAVNAVTGACTWASETMSIVGDAITGFFDGIREKWEEWSEAIRNSWIGKLIAKGKDGVSDEDGGNKKDDKKGDTGSASKSAKDSAPQSSGGGSQSTSGGSGSTGGTSGGDSNNANMGSATSTPYKYNGKTYNVNGIKTADMREMGLHGSIWSGNSKPYVGVQNAENVKKLDDKLKEWGYGVTYTSGMGGSEHKSNSGHYKGNKIDMQLTKNGKTGDLLTKEQKQWLIDNGYVGNGAVGWEKVKGQSGGGHYDLRVDGGGNKSIKADDKDIITNYVSERSKSTTSNGEVKQQADDGVRDALLAFAGASKKSKEGNNSRNLVFEAMDVTGSMGCWGIMEANNTGGK